VNHDDVMGSNDRLGVTGAFGKNSEFNCGGDVTYSDYNSGSQNSASGVLGWRARYANLNGSHSYSSNYQQASVSAAGGIVVQGGGFTLADDSKIFQIHITSLSRVQSVPFA
jgi:outer membrane usher protein